MAARKRHGAAPVAWSGVSTGRLTGATRGGPRSFITAGFRNCLPKACPGRFGGFSRAGTLLAPARRLEQASMNRDAGAASRPVNVLFDPFDDAYLADPYPFLARAREAAPLFYSDAIDHWIVTRYHDIRHMLRTPGLFSAA